MARLNDAPARGATFRRAADRERMPLEARQCGHPKQNVVPGAVAESGRTFEIDARDTGLNTSKQRISEYERLAGEVHHVARTGTNTSAAFRFKHARATRSFSLVDPNTSRRTPSRNSALSMRHHRPCPARGACVRRGRCCGSRTSSAAPPAPAFRTSSFAEGSMHGGGDERIECPGAAEVGGSIPLTGVVRDAGPLASRRGFVTTYRTKPIEGPCP